MTEAPATPVRDDLDPAREEVLIIRTANGWTIQHSNVVYPATPDGKPVPVPLPRNMLVAVSPTTLADFVQVWASAQHNTRKDS